MPPPPPPPKHVLLVSDFPNLAIFIKKKKGNLCKFKVNGNNKKIVKFLRSQIWGKKITHDE